MLDLTPKSGKAEIHLLYECTLACRHCNRQSFLRNAHTPPMTLDDVAEFLHQAQQLRWFPALLLIGGEPTLHPDFDRICELCRDFADLGTRLGLGYPEKGLQGLVQLWSNQTTEAAREACARVRARYNISVCEQTIKRGETIPVQIYRRGDAPEGYEFDIQDIMVSPADLGYTRGHCWQHGAEICGISVDSQGYSPCSTGGAVAGMLGGTWRTKVLADLFDPEKVAAITAEMCRDCGNCLSRTGIPGQCPPDEWREKMAALPRWRGMPVSPTWEKALEGRS